MRVLYISNKPIFPTIDGGCVAMENFLNCLLHANLKVKHLYIETDKHPFIKDAYPADISEKITPEGCFINTEVRVSKAIPSLFKKGSYNIDRFYDRTMEQLIVKTLKSEQFDCIILESLFLTPYTASIKKNTKSKLFVRTHNVESLLWKSFAENTRFGLKKKYLEKLAKDLHSHEILTLNNVDGILGISEDDLVAFKQLGVQTPFVHIPVAISVDKEQSENGNMLFHLGAMNWQPNIEAVEELIELFKELRETNRDLELHIGGSKSKEVVKEDRANGVYVDGFIEDLNEFAHTNGILVSPIRSGSGIRIKILEMMAIGIPVITTTLGALGIDHEEAKCLITANTKEELLKACQQLIDNKDDRVALGKRAMAYIRKNHDIELISKDILEFIERK